MLKWIITRHALSHNRFFSAKLIFICCCGQYILQFYFAPDAEKQHVGSSGSPAEGARRHVREGQQGDEEHSGQGIGAMVSVVVVLHIGNKDMKSTEAKVVLILILEVVVVVGNKSVYSTQAKMLVPCRSCCV